MRLSLSLFAIPALVVGLGLGCGSTPAPDRYGQEPECFPTRSEALEDHAFPPTIPDTAWHQDAWWTNDCLRCHETGVGDAPELVHRGLPEILATAKCRTCHVLIPGSEPREREQESDGFAPNAFPPMIPASEYHAKAWLRDDCMLCHESGNKGAPKVVHRGMPDHLLTAKCRTCHVQVRAVEAAEER